MCLAKGEQEERENEREYEKEGVRKKQRWRIGRLLLSLHFCISPKFLVFSYVFLQAASKFRDILQL